LVWLDMDQQDLDEAYDQLVYAPNRDYILKRCAHNSELARERLGAPKRFAYGATAIEALDVFTAKVANAPVSVFVHGGAWRTGLAKNYAYAAEMFVNAGAHHVVLDFNNVLETGGDLMVMADQVRRAVAWVYRNAKSFGGDPERIHVCGHSSGGHLTGGVLSTDWQRDFGWPATVSKGGGCGSIHRRDGGEAQPPAPPRPAARAGRAGLRHPGDARVPAPEPRFRRRGRGRRQAGDARRDGKLQP